jgi:hypothetical protein
MKYIMFLICVFMSILMFYAGISAWKLNSFGGSRLISVMIFFIAILWVIEAFRSIKIWRN